MRNTKVDFNVLHQLRKPEDGCSHRVKKEVLLKCFCETRKYFKLKVKRLLCMFQWSPVLELYIFPSPLHHQKKQCPPEWNRLGETLPNVALISARIWFGCIFPFSLNSPVTIVRSFSEDFISFAGYIGSWEWCSFLPLKWHQY